MNFFNNSIYKSLLVKKIFCSVDANLYLQRVPKLVELSIESKTLSFSFTLSERSSCSNSTERFLNSNLTPDGSRDRTRSKTQRLTFY